MKTFANTVALVVLHKGNKAVDMPDLAAALAMGWNKPAVRAVVNLDMLVLADKLMLGEEVSAVVAGMEPARSHHNPHDDHHNHRRKSRHTNFHRLEAASALIRNWKEQT